LTVIIGAKCSDGVAMIADTKFTNMYGGKPKYRRKLFGDLAHSIVCYTGSEEAFNFFRKYIIGDVVINRDTSGCYTLENSIVKISAVVGIINRRMGNLRTNDYFEVLIAQHRGADSKLYYINKYGRFKEFNYKAIGSGVRTANDFCSSIPHDTVTMKDFTKVAYCSIMYLDQFHNSGVGVRPDGIPMMRYLDRGKNWDKEPPKRHIREFQRYADEELKKSNNALKSLIRRVHSAIKFS
jgi:20S proteasome alpha/beta subunit